MSQFLSVTQRLFTGFGVTCEIFAATLIFAIPLGVIICLCSMSRFKPLRWISRTFVWIIRGTPLMLQVIIVFYGPGLLFQAKAFPRLTAVLIAFIVNYAAYFSEIYRGGFESIPKGQYEAAQVLGMTKTQTFFKVILMQIVKRIVPAMGNEVITLVKDTSLARVIAVQEIIMVAQEYITASALIWPLFYSGAFYLIFSGILTLLLRKLENKLSYFQV